MKQFRNIFLLCLGLLLNPGNTYSNEVPERSFWNDNYMNTYNTGTSDNYKRDLFGKSNRLSTTNKVKYQPEINQNSTMITPFSEQEIPFLNRNSLKDQFITPDYYISKRLLQDAILPVYKNGFENSRAITILALDDFDENDDWDNGLAVGEEVPVGEGWYIITMAALLYALFIAFRIKNPV